MLVAYWPGMCVRLLHISQVVCGWFPLARCACPCFLLVSCVCALASFWLGVCVIAFYWLGVCALVPIGQVGVCAWFLFARCVCVRLLPISLKP